MRMMDIKELTADYRRRFEAYNRQFDEDSPKRRKAGKNALPCPNYLNEVVRPILDSLPGRLPQYGFRPLPDNYAMYGEHYRIKTGVTLIGGLSVGEDFEPVFTPMFHGKTCGEPTVLSDMEQFVKIIGTLSERRLDAAKKKSD